MTSPQTAAAAGVTAAATFQAAQDVVATELATRLRGVVAGFDLTNLRTAIPNITAIVAGMVRRYGSASTTLAVHHYVETRLAAGVRGSYTPVHAPPTPLPQIGSTVQWATQPLWQADPDVAAAEGQIIAGAEKLVMDAARDTTLLNVERDRKARGWARVPERSACWFCAMLATRGAAYRNDRTASFRSHDHCRCHAEPVFGEYEPTAQIREWQALYNDSTGGMHGSKRMQKAFREAYKAKYPTA